MQTILYKNVIIQTCVLLPYFPPGLRWSVGIPTGIIGDGLLIGVILLLMRLRKAHTALASGNQRKKINI